jgi:hypothetical protein
MDEDVGDLYEVGDVESRAREINANPLYCISP